MKLPIEVFGNVAVVHTPEELGEDLADNLESYLLTLRQTEIVIDLDGTETIDSYGLTSLINIQESLRETGGNMKISTRSAVNRKILEITRLDSRLDVFECVIDAVKSFN